MSKSEHIDKKCFDRVTSEYIDDIYIRDIRLFSLSLPERVLPSFQNIEEEAKELEEDCCSNAHNEYEMDVAYVRSLDWSLSMSKIRQSLINLHAVGLRHLFEQQVYDLTYIVRVDEPFKRNSDNKKDKRSIEEKEKLRYADLEFDKILLKENGGIDLETLDEWDTIKELICVSNVVKHAEGKSMAELRNNYPDLLNNPTILNDDLKIRDLLVNRGIKRAIRNPLAGDEIYIKEQDIQRYANAIENFWRDLIRSINIRLGHE